MKPAYFGKKVSIDFESIVKESMNSKQSWGLLQNDIMFAVVFCTMIESGFTVFRSGNEKKSKNMEDEMTLPENWKHGTKRIYEAQFILPPYEKHLTRLVALPADDILCINVLVSDVSPRNVNLKSLAISSSIFVPRPEATSVFSKFSNLEYFRRQLKTVVIWPIRCSILTDEGILNGSLCGLSNEMKLKIFSFLEVKDLLALGETCNDLNRICNDQGLWKILFHNHFNRFCKCLGKHGNCEEPDTAWKENYKQLYKTKSNSSNFRDSSMDSFHTAPDSTYYDVEVTLE